MQEVEKVTPVFAISFWAAAHHVVVGWRVEIIDPKGRRWDIVVIQDDCEEVMTLSCKSGPTKHGYWWKQQVLLAQ